MGHSPELLGKNMFGGSKSKRISLAYQDLKEIPSKILKKDGGQHVEELDLSNNKIKDFKFLLELPNLHTLILDRNGITAQTKFPELPNISTLWVNHNKITNLGVFISTISKSFPNLQFLSMMNNEAAPSYFNGGSYMQYKDYRFYVISQLPNLKTLDDSPVDEKERAEAERIYAAILPGWQTQVVLKKRPPEAHDTVLVG